MVAAAYHGLTLLFAVAIDARWSPDEIVKFMKDNPQRAYFSRLFRDGGFRRGLEVGVACGRLSEHFLIDNKALDKWHWGMIEPFPTAALATRIPSWGGVSSNFDCGEAVTPWESRGVGTNAELRAIKAFSTDATALEATTGELYDFIYLDGAHDYVNVKAELPHYWARVAPGGVLAGHDYCYKGEHNGTRWTNGSLVAHEQAGNKKLHVRGIYTYTPLCLSGVYREKVRYETGGPVRAPVA